MANGPNPVKAIQDHLPEHIKELEADLTKAVARVRELQTDLAVAKTLHAVATSPTEEGR